MRNAKFIRVAKGATLFAVATATGIEQSRLSRFETGKRKLSEYNDLKTLAQYYGCTIDDLLLDVPEGDLLSRHGERPAGGTPIGNGTG